MTEIKHSPLPWRLSEFKDGRKNDIYDAGSHYIAVAVRCDLSGEVVESMPDTQEADAALIVKAVNNHAKLTDDNAKLVEALEGLCQDLRERQDDGANYNPGLLQALENAEAALAAVKEE